MIGELALLRDTPRTATVTATVPTVALTGDAEAFGLLLDLPGVRERIERVVSARLAEFVRPVPANLQDGTPILLRPLLPSDRDGIAAAIREMSAQSLQRRFFSGGQPTEQLIDYLVSIDYINHFAWLVLDAQCQRTVGRLRDTSAIVTSPTAQSWRSRSRTSTKVAASAVCYWVPLVQRRRSAVSVTSRPRCCRTTRQ